ncbi:MAG TPA: DUF6644 family protein [Bryobacteraceae bacterium]|jgi:hypothetical protein|nr:DUF6644 family protein [Bryobacteraceae bacterium]
MFLAAAANPLNASELVFPTLEVIHIVGFAVLVGTIAIVDFRLLGIGMRRQKVAELASDLAPWTLIGLTMVLLSGPLMFSSDPDMYYLNRAFQVKMVLLLLAIIFQYTVHRSATKSEGPPLRQKLVACVSMTLWVGIIFGGIFIAFI